MFRSCIQRCDRGTSTVELAFLAPLLTMFVLGMSDLATAISKRYVITKASIRATELALSAGVRDGSYDYLRFEAASAAGVPPENVTVEYWLECDYEKAPTTDTTCVSPSLPFRYIKVIVNGEYKPRFYRIFGPSLPMTGASVVRVQ